MLPLLSFGRLMNLNKIFSRNSSNLFYRSYKYRIEVNLANKRNISLLLIVETFRVVHLLSIFKAAGDLLAQF
jgi:hypothetical protein